MEVTLKDQVPQFADERRTSVPAAFVTCEEKILAMPNNAARRSDRAMNDNECDFLAFACFRQEKIRRENAQAAVSALSEFFRMACSW